MSAPLSPSLANIEPKLAAVWFFGDAKPDGTHQAYVTQEYHEAWMDEMKRRWERDKAFARRVCSERGFDIDQLASGDPDYA